MPEDEVALMQQLHDEHAGALWGYCLRLTGHDRGRAEDVVQETLLRAWRHAHGARRAPRPPCAAWLFTVARNIVIDEWRSRRARSEIARRRGPRAAPPTEDDRTDQLLLSWVVAEALTQLSADHRAVLLECYYRGRPVAEAARRLGIPRGHREVPHPLRAARAAARARGDGGERMSTSRATPTHDGAYVLGALSPAERLEFERAPRHLRRVLALGALPAPGCPGCSTRVDPGVLEDPPADPPLPATLLPSVTRAVEVRSRRRVLVVAGLAAAAAAVVALAVPAVLQSADTPVSGPGTSTSSPQSPGSPDGGDAVETREMAPLGHVPVEASLGLERVAWGTRMLLTCTYDKDAVEVDLPEQVDYLLFVTASDGRSEQVGSWTSSSGATMEVPAATSVPRDDIASVEVRTTSGRVVLRLDA